MARPIYMLLLVQIRDQDTVQRQVKVEIDILLRPLGFFLNPIYPSERRPVKLPIRS